MWRLGGDVHLEERAADGDVARVWRLQLHLGGDELVEPRRVDGVAHEVGRHDELLHIRNVRFGYLKTKGRVGQEKCLKINLFNRYAHSAGPKTHQKN